MIEIHFLFQKGGPGSNNAGGAGAGSGNFYQGFQNRLKPFIWNIFSIWTKKVWWRKLCRILNFFIQNQKENVFESKSTAARKNILVIEKKICKNFEITRTTCLNSERSENFLVTNAFFACSRMLLISNKLEQLEFKLEEIIGI